MVWVGGSHSGTEKCPLVPWNYLRTKPDILSDSQVGHGTGP